jgi:hypothetical protein
LWTEIVALNENGLASVSPALALDIRSINGHRKNRLRRHALEYVFEHRTICVEASDCLHRQLMNLCLPRKWELQFRYLPV